MDYMAESYLQYRTIHIEELIGPRGKNQKNMREVDPPVVKEYAAEDADITLKLKNILEKEISRSGLEHLFHEVESPHLCAGRYGVDGDTPRPGGAERALRSV